MSVHDRPARVAILATTALIAAYVAACDSELLSIDRTPPPTPTGLAAEAGDEKIVLTWNDIVYTDDQGYGYNVFQGTAEGELEHAVGPFAGEPRYVASGLTNGVRYYFAVSAESFGAESARSPAISAEPGPRWLVVGEDLAGPERRVTVLRRTTGLDGADVRVDGTPLSGRGGGVYEGAPDVEPPVGASVTMTVSVAGTAITGVGTRPVAPTIVAPSTGSTFGSGDVVPLRWETSTDPDRFTIRVCWDGCGESVSYEIHDGTARTLDLPLLGLPLDEHQDYVLHITGANDGVFTGPSQDGSRMDLRSTAPPSTAPSIRITP